MARAVAPALLAKALASAPAPDERDPDQLLIAASQAGLLQNLLAVSAQVGDSVTLPEEVVRRLGWPSSSGAAASRCR